MNDLFYAGRARTDSGSFTIKLKDGTELIKKLEKMNNGGKTVLKNTVSDVALRAPGWISKGIRQHYGVDTAAIKDAGPKKKRGATKINAGGLSVDGISLVYSGRTLTPTHFRQSPKVPTKERQKIKIKVPGQMFSKANSPVIFAAPPKKKGIKATIIKGSRVSLPEDAFIAYGNGGATIPFQRTGASRMPIEGIRTLSVPQMISGRAKETIEEIIEENTQKRLQHNMERTMS